MKIFRIIDESLGRNHGIAYLFCYEKSGVFSIEISDRTDPAELPIMLASFAEKGMHTVDPVWSSRWVSQRIIPSDRQNLGMVLRENGLKEYDSLRLLMKGRGRCAQDDCCIQEIREADLPDWMQVRLQRKLQDIFPIGSTFVLAAFADGTMRKIDLAPFLEVDRKLAVLQTDRQRFEMVHLQPGGCGICWQDWQMVSAEKLYDAGELLPITFSEYQASVGNDLMDTSEVCDMLHCSRQYVDSLVKRGQLPTASDKGRTRYYHRSDVLPLTW